MTVTSNLRPSKTTSEKTMRKRQTRKMIVELYAEGNLYPLAEVDRYSEHLRQLFLPRFAHMRRNEMKIKEICKYFNISSSYLYLITADSTSSKQIRKESCLSYKKLKEILDLCKIAYPSFQEFVKAK